MEILKDEVVDAAARGTLLATPLFLGLVLIEFTDLIFAVDSIPAIFAITSDPFLVFTSNVFALLGLRSLYFALAGMIEKFRYLKVSLAFVLCADRNQDDDAYLAERSARRAASIYLCWRQSFLFWRQG